MVFSNYQMHCGCSSHRNKQRRSALNDDDCGNIFCGVRTRTQSALSAAKDSARSFPPPSFLSHWKGQFCSATWQRNFLNLNFAIVRKDPFLSRCLHLMVQLSIQHTKSPAPFLYPVPKVFSLQFPAAAAANRRFCEASNFSSEKLCCQGG